MTPTTSNMDLVSSFASIMLAMSLVVERFITICKTAWPWLALEKTSDGTTDLKDDRMRRLVVHALAIAGGWISACLIGDVGPFGQVTVAGSIKIYAPLLGFLASGGSAIWSNVVNYTKAAKDVKIQQRDTAAATGMDQGAPPAAPVGVVAGAVAGAGAGAVAGAVAGAGGPLPIRKSTRRTMA